MLLAIDVGNTNTVFGLFSSNQAQEPQHHWRASTRGYATSDEWHAALHVFAELAGVRLKEVERVMLASVVPSVTSTFERLFRRLHVPLHVLDCLTPTGVPLDVPNPREVGPDRIANAVSVTDRFASCIVVDLGTATTLDVIQNGSYVGGVIMPGIEVSITALIEKTAGLRRVSIETPEEVLGTSTMAALQSGLTYGVAAQVDGLIDRLREEIGPCEAISTGGLGGVIAPLSKRIVQNEPWLTLVGLSKVDAILHGG